MKFDAPSSYRAFVSVLVRRRLIRPAALIFVSLLALGPARAQIEVAKISVSGTFGTLTSLTMSLDGDTLIVGSPFDETAATGSASVFVRRDGVWEFEAKLTPDDGRGGDEFGASVDVYGDTALIGRAGLYGHPLRGGSAYVFVRQDGVWSQQAELQPPGGVNDDLFGLSATIYGDTAVVGAFGDNGGGSKIGAAFVYVRDGEDWQFQAKLAPSSPHNGARFGTVVTLEGDRLLVTSFSTSGFPPPNQAYVFSRQGTTWVQEGQFGSGLTSALDRFGLSAALSGDTVLVGAPNASGGGKAYVFHSDGGQWSMEAALAPSDVMAFDGTGYAVALDGDTAIVTATGDDGAGYDAGAAYVFERRHGQWGDPIPIIGSDVDAYSYYGVSAVLQRDTAIVAREDTLYIFDLQTRVRRTAELADEVSALGLPEGLEQSFLDKLAAASMALRDGRPSGDAAARGPLQAFIHEVSAQDGQGLSHPEAEELIADAEEILGLLD